MHLTEKTPKKEKLKKGRFSLFELELKPGVDAKDLLKKAGGSQPIGTNNVTSSIDDGKSKTLTHKSHPSSKSIKLKHKKKGKKNGINTLIKAVCESPKTRNT